MQNGQRGMRNDGTDLPSRCLSGFHDPVHSSGRSGSCAKFKHRLGACLLCSAFIILHCVFASAEAPTTQPLLNFVRFTEDGHGGGKMQAALASYVNADGIQVDLLSTMHIGESSFFRDLSKRLPRYDAVLYELVAHRGEEATEEGVNDQQRVLAHDCGLENQGPHMNYDRKNFVHADLDLEDIEKMEIAQHGTFKGALGEGPGIKAAKNQEDTAGDPKIFSDTQAARTATPAERIRLLRRANSRLMAITSQPPDGATYPPGMQVLVGARNDKVIKVLAQQMAEGKKTLAVFYGAAHMVDLEHRLFQMGFKRQSVVWQTAWTVAPDGTPTTQQEHAKH
jgi:hypothetical protein